MKRSFTLAAVAVAILVLSPKTPFAQTSGGSPASQPLGRMVDVGGYRLHINCAGRGNPTVVLIAGSGDFSFDWSLVQPDVSRVTRVCSYDRAGIAWSDPGPTPRTMRQDAYELHKLLGAARVKGPYVLVGHSIGGLIARVYAEQYPDEVAGVVLVDPTHEDTTLMYQGKIVRVREGAKGVSIPPVQTMRSSPPKPPAAEILSVNNCRMIRMRLAPRAERTAISLCLAVAQVSSKFATLAQAISRTNVTAPRRTRSTTRIRPTTSSLSDTTVAFHPASAPFGPL